MEVRRSADVRQFRHSLGPGVVTIKGDPDLEVPPGTLRSVFVPAATELRKKPS